MIFVSVISKSFRYANYVKFIYCNKTLEDYNFLKIMGRDAIDISVTYRKIGFRFRVFLDIPTQQNQINKHHKIETKKRIFRIETLISYVY